MLKKRGKLVGGGGGGAKLQKVVFSSSSPIGSILVFCAGTKVRSVAENKKKVRDRKRNNFGRKRNRNFSMLKKTETDIFYFKRIF